VTLSDVSIERPVLTWMMVLALVVFGLVGYSRLGVDRFPEMAFPEVQVTARLEGAAPLAMEEDVTDVLEEHLNTIAGVRSLRSASLQGACRVTVEFELGTPMDAAVQDVRDQVALAMAGMPKGMDLPIVSKQNFSSFPVIYVPFLSDRPAVEVSEYVTRTVKPLVETIPGVGSVGTYGQHDRNIRIWLDSEALRARGLAASDVIAALRREHVEVPGGIVEGMSLEWSVKTEAEFASIEALEEMVVRHSGDAPIYLKDVARVEDGVEDIRAIYRYNFEPAVIIGVTKQSDANTVAVVDEVKRRIAELEPFFPTGIRTVPSDQFVDFSVSIREAVDETLFALFFGALLAVFVVFVFLRRTRPTLIVAAAIPLSLLGTFGLVWLAGYTMNTMTLLGMTLAIGVVIDDAIIVLENIERHREIGKDSFAAARDGTRQITFAAAAATFSVAAVFLPVALATGIIGNFLGEFGLTVAGSVIISLFVALTLTPMLAARMPAPKERAEGSIYQRLERGFRHLEEGYRVALDWTLRHRAITVGVAIASFLAAIAFARALDGEFFPKADGRIFYTQFKMPAGASVDAAGEMLDRDEAFYQQLPELKSLFVGVGSTSHLRVGRPNEGALFATLNSPHERERTSMEIMREARKVLGRIPGQQLQVMDPSSFSGGSEFEMELRGNVAIAELDKVASGFVHELRQTEGFVDVAKNLEIGLPEVRVIPDRKKAAALGVDAAAVGEIVQVMIGGMDVGTFKEDGRRYDIRMRLDREDRDHPASIRDLSVRSVGGKVVDLRNLVTVETGAAAAEISRSNRQRSVTISANLEGIALQSAVEKAMSIADRMLPERLELVPTGSAETMRESFSQFFFMFVLAVLVIYMVLAAQFESFILPLSVMLALPFSLVGALGGLWALGMTLNVFSLIGIVLLLGLVTKNSILLVDYANQLRAEGRAPIEAMREAAPVRMRPVLMTALSMIFGVLPAAIGLGPGSETRAPMAIATAAGMFSSVLLTLLIVPLFYVLLEEATAWVRRLPARLRADRRPALP